MLKSLSNILNKNVGEIYRDISNIEETDFSNLNKDDFIKYQNIINNINKKIEHNNNMVIMLNNFVNISENIVSILLTLPIPTAPFPVTVGLILTASNKLNYLQKLLEDIKSYLLIHDKIKLEYETNLMEISSNFMNNENNFLINSTQSQNIISNLNKVVTEYKNYSIYLKEDSSANFVKYYAVAFDKIGKEFLRTDSSHLTNTQILIDKIKFLIDKNY